MISFFGVLGYFSSNGFVDYTNSISVYNYIGLVSFVISFSGLGVFWSYQSRRLERIRRGGAYSFVACLNHLTIDHASLSRRSTVPTPNRANSWGVVYTRNFVRNVQIMHGINIRVTDLFPILVQHSVHFELLGLSSKQQT